MPSVEKISIALPPEMVAKVRSAVESGEYASSSEVIRDALRDWARKRVPHANSIEDLRALWREAVKDKRPSVDMEKVMDRLERKYHAKIERKR
jgi:antitoxin ParD1/3/4